MNVVFDNTGGGIDVGPISGNSPVTFGKDFTITEGTHFQYGSYTGVTTFSGNLIIDGVLGFNGGARSLTVASGKNLSVGVNGAVNMQATQTATIKGTAIVNGDLGGGGSVAITNGGALTLSSVGIIDADSGTTVGGTGLGRLTGSGTVTQLVIAGGGTVAPGDAGAGPGTLHGDRSLALARRRFLPVRIEIRRHRHGRDRLGSDLGDQRCARPELAHLGESVHAAIEHPHRREQRGPPRRMGSEQQPYLARHHHHRQRHHRHLRPD